MSNPTTQALAEVIAGKADTAMVCDAITTLPLLTVSDAANLVRAIGLRAAATPLTMPGRSQLCNLLEAAERDLLNLWTRAV